MPTVTPTLSTRTIPALLALLLAALLFPSAGCDTVKAPAGVRTDQLAADAYPQGVVMGGLDKWLVAAKPIVDVSTPDRPMKVTVPIRSIADEGINVQYKFEFFDRAGRPLRTNQGWAFMNIAPRVQVFMEATALDTNADDFRLQVRPAR